MTWSQQWWHNSLHSVLPAKANLQAKPDVNRAGIQSFHSSEGCQDSQGHAWHYGTGLHNPLSDRDNTIRAADRIQYDILQRNAGKSMCVVKDLTHGKTESLKQASQLQLRGFCPSPPQLSPALQAKRHLPSPVVYVSLQGCHMELSQGNIWPLNVLFIKIICPRESKLAKSDEINKHKSRNADRAKTGNFQKME